jgi:glycolate oxidase FAD binding subunit
MVKQASLVDDLAAIVGAKHVRESGDEPGWSVEDMEPRVAVEPGTHEEVAEIIRLANRQGLAVIPRGRGYQLSIGNIPERYDISLVMDRLNRVIDYQPSDLTVTCEAGIGIGDLQRQLSASSQFVPLGYDEECENPLSVGGQLAMNESDFRAAYGRPRDFTIGMKVVTGDGRLVRAGGKVVKNVAGYDMCKLFVASMGTLGVIVEATFKVAPYPPAWHDVELAFASIDAGCEFAREINRRSLNLLMIEIESIHRHRPDEKEMASWLLSVTLAGSEAGVERSRLEIEKLAADFGARPYRPPAGPPPPRQLPSQLPLSVSACVLPSLVPAAVHALKGEFTGARVSADPVSGEVSGDDIDALDQRGLIERARGAIAALGGTLVVRGCSPELKREIDVYGDPPPSFPLMRAVKQQFDPNHVLSPGRFVGRL